MKEVEIPEVTALDLAFGNIDHLPPMSEIPEDFKRGVGDSVKWVKAQRQWFYNGVKKSQFKAKPGVDIGKALRLLAAIQCSFEPKHEQKEAGVAYLMSQYFDDFVE